MARICEITGKKTISGNRRSHANNKTKRKFVVNLQKKRLFFEELGIWIACAVSTQAIRTISKNGLLPTLRKSAKAGTLSPNLLYILSLIASLKNTKNE